MGKNAVEALLAKMNLSLTNLPKILVTDPEAKKLGAKPGDVIEIKRTDFGRKASYYRLVAPEA